MPRVQHKDTVLAALTAAQKPMTASQIDGVAGIGVSEVRKAPPAPVHAGTKQLDVAV